jgi:hypothetical protein
MAIHDRMKVLETEHFTFKLTIKPYKVYVKSTISNYKGYKTFKEVQLFGLVLCEYDKTKFDAWIARYEYLLKLYNCLPPKITT